MKAVKAVKNNKQRTNDDEMLEELLGEEGWDETYADSSWEDKGKENRIEEVEDENGDGEEDGEDFSPHYIDAGGFRRKRRMSRGEENRAMNKAMRETLEKRERNGKGDGGIVDEECEEELNKVCSRVIMRQLQAARKCAGVTQAAMALRMTGKNQPIVVSKYEVGSGLDMKTKKLVMEGKRALGMNLTTLVGLLAAYGLGLKLEVVDYEEMVRWSRELEEKLEEGGFVVEPRITVEDWEKTYEVRRMEWDAEDQEGKLLPGQLGRRDDVEEGGEDEE